MDSNPGVYTVSGSGVYTISGSGVYTVSGSGVYTVSGSGVYTVSGSGVYTVSGSGVPGVVASERSGVKSAVSVSTQADIAHVATSYDSEDENTGRRKNTRSADDSAINSARTTMYSKQEFREQYCITNKQLDLLELDKSKKDRFLGCLSQYHLESPCSRANRSSFLSVCVRRRAPSDENLNVDYAPIQRYPRNRAVAAPMAELRAHDAELQSSYFRRRPRSVCSLQPDPTRYTWPADDEDYHRMEWPQVLVEDRQGWPQGCSAEQMLAVTRGGSLPRPPTVIPCPAHSALPPPPPPPAQALPLPPHRPKHVSFARSHTLTTFDESVMPAALSTRRPSRRDCTERLLDSRPINQPPEKQLPLGWGPVLLPAGYPHMTYFPPPPAPVHYPAPMPLLPAPTPAPPRPALDPPQPKVVVIDSLKKGVMRTQATQTEVCLGRKALPPNYLSLSPRTIKRVTMVAAGVQTNGFSGGGRRLTKSFSEIGGDRLIGNQQDLAGAGIDGFVSDHDKLHRTQSEEPPKSPRSPPAMSSPLDQHHLENELPSPVRSIVTDFHDLQRQAQDYFQQFQFIHESDRDDTIDNDLESLEKSMALNRKNLEYLQQKIAEETKGDKIVRSILSKSMSDSSQRTSNSQQVSKTPTFQSEPSTETTTTTDDSEKEKEIIIDFEPRPDDEALIFTKPIRPSRRFLQKALSEGEILLDVRKSEIHQKSVTIEGVKDAPLIMSTSQENMTEQSREREERYKQYLTQNYVQTPIKDEGIFGFEPDGSYSSSDGNGTYENFHEKYFIYKDDDIQLNNMSFDEPNGDVVEKVEEFAKESTALSSPASPTLATEQSEDSKLKKTALAPLERTSPFASNESLTVDPTRDHSDGIWNESQATVLQVDSGTDNGTVISSSDLSSLATSPGALALLTPTSRRKQLLLLQHQQRSSMDTDALEEELEGSQTQSPTSPRLKLDTNPSQASRASLSPPAVVPSVHIPITKQPTPSRQTGFGQPKHAPAIAITHPSLDLTEMTVKRTPSIINKKRERALSPSRRKDLQRKAQKNESNGAIPSQIRESPIEGRHNSETNLARTDSGKTNTTDVSESTTTEDYVTANSDSSKKSNRTQNHNAETKPQEGSSFESASSLYSLTRAENNPDDQIVQCLSPPLQLADDFVVPSFTPPPKVNTEILSKTYGGEKIQVRAEVLLPPLPKRDKTESKIEATKNSKHSANKEIDGKSSSSGSYSIRSPDVRLVETNTAESTLGTNNSPQGDTVKQLIKSDELEEREQTVPTIKGSVSDDERSGNYSSSGYYESPVDDDDDDGLTYKHSQKYKSSNRPRVFDEKRRKKKSFALEFSKSYDDSISTSQEEQSKRNKTSFTQERHAKNVKSPTEEITKCKMKISEKSKSLQSSPREPIDVEKTMKDRENDVKKQERERHVKRTKQKSKSPIQSKISESKKPQYFDRKLENLGPSAKLHLNIPTSDDSSEQYKRAGMTSNGNVSPRKHRRLRDSPRRKTGINNATAKSPTNALPCNHSTHKCKRKNDTNDSISLPGSLPRRKPSVVDVDAGLTSLEVEHIEMSRTLGFAGSMLNPLRYNKSPTTSPRPCRKIKDGKCNTTVSAESLRSVSPGSDSVFYSEHAEAGCGAAVDEDDAEAKAHCLHCGKEVHIVTASHEHETRTSQTDESYVDPTPDIVPAPANFADSPAGLKRGTSGARLYKKLDKRFRSEEKSRHHHRHRPEVRAKSEERGKEEYAASEKKEEKRIARSAGTSLDKLASRASEDNEEDAECERWGEEHVGAESADSEGSVYAAPWWCGNWILVSAQEDLWGRLPLADRTSPEPADAWSDEATESETEFSKKYAALTHRLVHRRACIHMYRRQADNCFVQEKSYDPHDQFRKKLEEILRLMLMLWCRQCQANKLVASEPAESDKTVVVRKGSEEFGFRIHGSKPVVVSAIEPDTPAETSGLEVGDIVIAVNGINVLDKSHSEVVKIAHAGSEILELEVARTCEAVATLAHEGGAAALFSGYLWRLPPARPHSSPKWTRRWFVLKRDNCLYFYKTDSSQHPVGALMLINYQLSADAAGKPHGFRLQRGGGARLALAADTAEAAARWQAVLQHAIDASNKRDGWLEMTMRNMKLPPSSIPRPDCFGYLAKLGSRCRSWTKRYCVLKDACLYFYIDGNSNSAFGMACLHGYRVQQCSAGVGAGAGAGAGGRKFALEVVPSEPKQRHFIFHTESEMDKKRWMAALEYSIDRWMKAG